MKKGKNYLSKKIKSDRPLGDFYHTPKSLVWKMESLIKKEFKGLILEPCYGQKYHPIYDVLKYDFNLSVIGNDLYSTPKGFDYILENHLFKGFDYIITNPPFSLWDAFILAAKSHCKKFMVLGRLNYLCTQKRLETNLFKNLAVIFPFSRYVDYRTKYRSDGLFNVGGLATAWFYFDMNYKGLPFISQLNVNQYAKLGQFKD